MISRAIVLIGLPAAGKSSIGALVADRLNRPFVDLDAEIENRHGAPVVEIFEREGEERFRQLEHDLLIEVLARDDHAIVAGGGGVVVTPGNRRALADDAVVVWLDVPIDVLLSRLEGDVSRPLLAGGTEERLRHLHRERLALYSTSADAIVTDTGVHPPAQLVSDVIAAVEAAATPGALQTEAVDFGDGRGYPVAVGRGARHQLAGLLPDGVARVAIITQEGVGVEVDPGVEHQVLIVEDGEEAKRLDVIGDLASRLAQWGLTRRDAIVSVGGGVVSDLAGYLAASYHRGVPVVHVSTTLLGQIDAAIGGKCGVNLPEGKNLLGAFKQPAAVICDTDTLATLPPAEFLSGMGELAKYHFLGGGRLDRLPLTPRVAACVRIKADVVVDDETEGGRRAILNYGHTLAHALESITDYGIRHGEAVAVGLIYAAELARALGRIDDDRVAEHRRVAAAYGLDTKIPDGLDGEEVVALFSRDKKAVDGITFVLDGDNGIEPVLVEDRRLLLSTLETVT